MIEHNLAIIKTADWIIDMGPEGGDGGGEAVAQGTPEDVVRIGKGHTARFLKEVLERRPIEGEGREAGGGVGPIGRIAVNMDEESGEAAAKFDFP